jgi:excinuclease ABC subunit C
VDLISEPSYKEDVENTILLLSGKVEKLLKIIQKKMQEASAEKKFEQAAHWRDFIFTIEQIKERPRFISVHPDYKDILGFSRKNENVAIYVFLMRKGKVIESEDMVFQEDSKISNKKILTDVLHHFYKNRPDIPKQIFLPFLPTQKLELQKRLSASNRKNIEFLVPLKGNNKRLVELANRNAETLLKRQIVEESPLREVKRILGLRTIPEYIEGFDLSNIGGVAPVGALVVFKNGFPQKKDYRKYKIKTIVGPNDVASLREVIQRRYSKLLQEKKELPDLVLVDGGKGQLNAARTTLQDLGLDHLPVASLAKKEEVIFTSSQKKGTRLERTSPALKLFQNIRDEAHRFALSYHRSRRKKRSFESQLDGIPGLGLKRKSTLISRYRNVKNIQKASPDELRQLIGPKATQMLLKKFS